MDLPPSAPRPVLGKPAGELVLLPVMFALISTDSRGLSIIGMGLATIPHAMYYAALAGLLAQVFPVEVRYTAISLCYQLCTTLFAGTAPMVCQFLLARTGSITPVVALGLGYVVLTLVCVIALLRRSSAFAPQRANAGPGRQLVE